jgi:NAD(P)-dependent dehydrogenase (short-subunit alcohol dehydrogenase family)
MYRARPEDGIALVTGASSGIGRAAAIELVRRGYKVAALARRADELDRLAQVDPQQIFPVPADITDAAAVATAIATIEGAHGPIALAFLNAGVSFLSQERKGFDASVIRQTQAINVGGTVNCLEPLLTRMSARGRGQIAVNASLAGLAGLPGSFGYGASKAALINLAEALALRYAPQGLGIQVICHGFVRTAMTGQEKTYAMPFMIEAEEAARRICDGFERGGFEISFPWQLRMSLTLLRVLPYGLRFPLLLASTTRARRRD